MRRKGKVNMNINKMLAALMALLLALAPALCAVAEANAPTTFAVGEEATPLPAGVNFTMDLTAIKKLLGDNVELDDWGEGEGQLIKDNAALEPLELTADSAGFQVDRNNSDMALRLSQISAVLPTGENCIAAFRAALKAVNAVYGEPDSDPFNEYAVESYVEYGNLSATWTKTDVRINLNMSRMFGEMLLLDFTNRLCYNPDDLK